MGLAQDWLSVITMGSDNPTVNPKHFWWQAWKEDFKMVFCIQDLVQDALACISQLQQGSRLIMDYCTMFFKLKGKLDRADADSEYMKDHF